MQQKSVLEFSFVKMEKKRVGEIPSHNNKFKIKSICANSWE